MILKHSKDKRAVFDFEVDFLNGGGLQGQGFRLDIDGEEIADCDLSDAVVRDLRLLMVDGVRILNKQIIEERHKRCVAGSSADVNRLSVPTYVDLSHTVHEGLVTLKGFPAPVICDFLSREDSRKYYDADTSFQIGRIDMVANTGTYLDSPFHRFEYGKDLSELELASLVGLDAVVARVTEREGRAVGREVFLPLEVRGKAVLVETGWSRHWATEQYFEGHSFLTREAAEYLRDAGAVLVGIDSYNIDDTSDGARPVHTILLGAGIPIVEHMCRIEELPTSGFRFTAVPVKVKGMGTFPVRAFATLGAP
ncbi:putative metal-dependent hydrolase [Terriglobus roseus DSM 18391]|uniref:Putative metal-dependent hydrolase n=1 Tax=Terriglobus roseus (strain DSM 18391 / NRRL B-41598 / KBS 63) TaxID=926566 RepID=I3ZJV1_TERRK|nr:cyclase family protein [Terriglobus roseus]AFL89519.1 putative metal-dependent hydrolase [Terriglobus roseus DSM 18391]